MFRVCFLQIFFEDYFSLQLLMKKFLNTEEKVPCDFTQTPLFQRERLAILREMSDQTVITDNVEKIAETVLGVALKHTDAERGSLMLVNENGELYISAARGLDPKNLVQNVRKGEGIAGSIAEKGVGVLVADIDHDQRFAANLQARYKGKSFISCPMLHNGKLMGVINLADKKTRCPFSEDEFAGLNVLANQAAITLENVYLMSQLRSKASQLEEISKRLIESDIAKNEFIMRVSHELRTPLNSIRGSIYYLGSKKRISRNKQKEFFDIIAHGANELRTRVEGLISFLRGENNRKGNKIVRRRSQDIP